MVEEIGPYRIVRLIGTGGMGSVYEAVHAQIQRRAALKVLHKDFQKDPEFVQRFFNEARAVNIINHPNVVAVYDFGTASDGSPYIVMEYLEGDSLRQRLARSGKLAPETAMRIGKQVALGLAAAHAKQVVHRDLKPVNIMLVLDEEGTTIERAKILDFGIAKLTSDLGNKGLTRAGASLGTPAYMSPEQCKSARDVSDRSDVYALGVILFEILTGEHPFTEARGDAAMMASHVGKEAPLLTSKVQGIPPELVSLVSRMLAKQPEARPSAGEVAATLGRISGSTTDLFPLVQLPGAGLAVNAPAKDPTSSGPTPAPWPHSLMRKLQDRRVLLIGAGLTLLFAMLGIFLVLRLLFDDSADGAQPVRWTIRSEPADAEVLDATGQVLGRTPFSYGHARGKQIEVLAIRKEGYTEQRAPIDCSRDGDALVALVALPAVNTVKTEATGAPDPMKVAEPNAKKPRKPVKKGGKQKQSDKSRKAH